MYQHTPLIIGAIFSIVFITCGSPEEQAVNQTPAISFTSPEDNSTFLQGETVVITAVAEDPENEIYEVRFHINDVEKLRDLDWPYEYSWETDSVDEGDYAIKVEVVDNAGAKAEAIINIFMFSNTVTDVDGNIYEVVQIGNQLWMAENLKVTHYRNGIEIRNEIFNSEWSSRTSSAYCYYDNDDGKAEYYGALYNWYAVANIGGYGIAPEGWHVPTDWEWKELEMYLGMNQADADNEGYRGTDQGAKLKDTLGWRRNNDATNGSGFSALPSGSRSSNNGEFYSEGNLSIFWSATHVSDTTSWMRTLHYDYSNILRSHSDMKYGYSVRCVRD